MVTITRNSGRSNITREENGIPHIWAEDEMMGFYSLGFIHSQDRLWQMDRARRVAQGRLSEIFGDKTIEVDKTMRNFGFERWANKALANLSPDLRARIQEYADGINEHAAINYHPLEYHIIGIEFRNWTIIDSLTVCGLMQLHLTYDWQVEVFRDFLYSRIGDEAISELVLPYEEENFSWLTQTILNDEELKQSGLYEEEYLKKHSKKDPRKKYEFEEDKGFNDALNILKSRGPGASNNWAIHGKHTKSGKPILANDPHLEAQIPTSFHLSEMRIGKDQFVIGASLPGVPMFAAARSHTMAWGVTSLNNDIADIFEEKINGTKYLFKKEWRDLEIVPEVIHIKDGSIVNHTVRYTHHGPVMDNIAAFFNKIDGGAPPLSPVGDFSFAWTCYETVDLPFESMFNLHKYKTVHEAVDTCKTRKGSVFSIMMADTSGNIGYYGSGTYPIRQNKISGS